MSTLGKKYAAKEQNRAKEFLRKYKNDPAAIARRFRAIARGADDRSIIKYNILLKELNKVAGRGDVLADLANNAFNARYTNTTNTRYNNTKAWNYGEWKMVNGPPRVYNLSPLYKYKSSKAKAKAPKAVNQSNVNTAIKRWDAMVKALKMEAQAQEEGPILNSIMNTVKKVTAMMEATKGSSLNSQLNTVKKMTAMMRERVKMKWPVPNNLTKNLKLQAKRLKIRVTNSVNGKRVPKSANKLRTQIQNALARR